MDRGASTRIEADTFELQTLQKKYHALPQQLAIAATNIDTVLDIANEARVVPLNEILPINATDAKAYACLRQIRNDFIGRVIVFRSVLLPASRDVVNGLHTFLDYMEDEETFLELAKAGEVSLLCNKHADEALLIQEGYETIATDLLRLGDQMDDKFKQVKLDVEKLLQEHRKNQKVASNLKLLSGGLVTTGLAGGAILALCLLGPGGVLFAPALAPAVFGVGVAGGSAAAVAAGHYASDRAEKGVALHATAQVLHEAHSASQQQLPLAVHKFAGAMEHLAKFFSQLHGSVQRIEATAARVESRLREDALDQSYRALYKVLSKQMQKVKVSCDDYLAFVSTVNIKVNNLQLRHDSDKPELSYIEEWFQAQQTHAEKKDAHAVTRLRSLLNRSIKRQAITHNTAATNGHSDTNKGSKPDQRC